MASIPCFWCVWPWLRCTGYLCSLSWFTTFCNVCNSIIIIISCWLCQSSMCCPSPLCSSVLFKEIIHTVVRDNNQLSTLTTGLVIYPDIIITDINFCKTLNGFSGIEETNYTFLNVKISYYIASYLLLYVTRFEITHLPCTQQQVTLFTITR